ncbi:hypothetical protein BDB00DRAFT_767175, partial [Zychaea mexicana]|uniref:uncharacterized protein n=1 Tax=Zychaea mexicana TaxID=64656 RepID=UPI0022FF2CE2
IPLNMFQDDTSGNRSKKWNRFESCSMVPAALPLDECNKRANTHLICVHNRLSSGEIVRSIVDDLKELEEGVEMYDAGTSSKVLVVAPLNLITADNPAHGELSCTKRFQSASYPCRKCFFRKRKNDERTTANNHISVKERSK